MKCDCGGTYKAQKVTESSGLEYSAYICSKCDDELFNREQALAYDRAFELQKIIQSLKPMKLRKCGNSIIATIPSKLAERLITSGKNYIIEPRDANSIIIRLVS